MLGMRTLPGKQAGGFTLIELLVVVALLALIAGMAVPRVSAILLDLSLIAEARYAHAHAQAVRQFAIMRGSAVSIHYFSSAPARIIVIDHQSGVVVSEFTERILPTGFRLEPVLHDSKIVTFNARGEATWNPPGGASYRIVIRAPHGQTRSLRFHGAGRIMLVKP